MNPAFVSSNCFDNDPSRSSVLALTACSLATAVFKSDACVRSCFPLAALALFLGAICAAAMVSDTLTPGDDRR